MKVYIVVELPQNVSRDVPRIVGVFRNKKDAETAAYSKERKNWCNIIEKELK